MNLEYNSIYTICGDGWGAPRTEKNPVVEAVHYRPMPRWYTFSQWFGILSIGSGQTETNGHSRRYGLPAWIPLAAHCGPNNINGITGANGSKRKEVTIKTPHWPEQVY